MKKTFILFLLFTGMFSQAFAGLNDSSGHFTLQGFGYGFSAGAWIPTGPLSIIGSHPCFGPYLNWRNEQILIDVNCNIRVGSSPNEYFVKKDDSVYKTTYFQSVFLGLGFGYVINRNRDKEVNLIGGIGYDGMDILSVPTNKGDTLTQTTKSLNVNAGIGYRQFVHYKCVGNIIKHSYLEIQLKYNFVHYANNGGTNLGGNSIMIAMTYGALYSGYRYQHTW